MVKKLFLTPPNLPGETQCRSLQIPSSQAWLGIFNQAILQLTNQYNYEQVNDTDMTPEDVAAACYDIYVEYLQNACGVGTPTPYWDNDTDIDDQEPADTQPWYGHVEGNTFIEDIAEWVIAGFIAEAASPAAAVLYRTYERKFRLAFLSEGLPGFARVVIDEVLAGRVDLSGDAGDIIEQDFVTDPEIEQHEVMIVYETE